MSVPPPPPPIRRGLSPAAAWLLALLIVAVGAVAIVALLTFGGDDEPDGSVAAPPSSETTDGAPAGQEGPRPSPAGETEATPGTPAGGGDGTPAPPGGGDTGMSLGELSLPSVPYSALVAACAHVPPARALPPGATDQTTLRFDFDGDGEPDTFSVYRDPGSARWFARMDTSWGFAAEIALEDVWGTASMNRIVRFGGDATALVHTAFADDPDEYRFFLYRDCEVKEVTPGGEPLVVGTVLPLVFPDLPPRVGGFTCTPDAVIVTNAVYDGRAGLPSHVVSSRSFTWDAASGAFSPGPEMAVASCCDWPEQREVIEGAGVFDCPGGVR